MIGEFSCRRTCSAGYKVDVSVIYLQAAQDCQLPQFVATTEAQGSFDQATPGLEAVKFAVRIESTVSPGCQRDTCRAALSSIALAL